jgi:hypothetical protein
MLLGTLHFLSMGLRNLSFGHPFLPAWWSVTNTLLVIAVGAALTPLVLLAFRGGPGAAGHRSWAVPMYVAIGLAYWLSWAVIVAGLASAGLIRAPGLDLSRSIVFAAFISLGTYGVLVMLHETIRSLSRARGQELEAARIQAELSRAEAAALRAGLNPDFLFRAFETAAGVMERDARAARRVLADLGVLLRASLGRNGSDLVSCQDELELLQRYLDIRRASPGERLRVQVDVEPAAAACRLPPLVLQPVVEALVPHDPAPGSPLTLTISAVRSDGELRIRVGTSAPASSAAAGSAGSDGDLDRIRARLGAIYGRGATLTPVRNLADGVEVEIRVPQADESDPYER